MITPTAASGAHFQELNPDAAVPTELFDPAVTTWSYRAIMPDALRSTQLPLPPTQRVCGAIPKHSSHYWTRVVSNQKFSGADKIDAPSFNRALWRGLKGDELHPWGASGVDLLANHAQLSNKNRLSSIGACNRVQ